MKGKKEDCRHDGAREWVPTGREMFLMREEALTCKKCGKVLDWREVPLSVIYM